MKIRQFLAAGLVSLGLAAPASAVTTPTAVDLELQLLVDVSGSVDSNEFQLQRDGYVAAFKDSSIINAITSGTIGSIAAQLVYWSGSTEQDVSVTWRHIYDAATSTAFADAIAAVARPFSGSTNIEDAILFANPKFDNNGFDGTRLVMDISGDGTSNTSQTEAARDAAEALGITINGLPIGGSSGVEDFYKNSVITSDGFSIAASSFTDFESAVKTKLRTEISGQIPLPAGGWLLLTGLGGLAALRRKRRAA